MQGQVINLSENDILDKIYFIRGKKVMLDRDLAKLYGVENKVLGQQVKRNHHKFPEDFMFRLTEEELINLRSQIVTANISPKSRVLPMVFFEHGILMLSNVLNSLSANQISVQIIRIFTKMREMVITQKDMLLKLEQLERKGLHHDKSLKQIFEILKKLMINNQEQRQTIGFKVCQNNSDREQ